MLLPLPSRVHVLNLPSYRESGEQLGLKCCACAEWIYTGGSVCLYTELAQVCAVSLSWKSDIVLLSLSNCVRE